MAHPNEAVLDANYAAWSSHNVKQLLEYFTPDSIYEDTAFGVVHHGHEGIAQFAEEVFQTQKDFRVRYISRFATDEKGAGQWVINTTWNGEFGGVDVTGKKVEFSGLSIYEFQNGKISNTIDCWDPTQLMRQFGVLEESLRSLK